MDCRKAEEVLNAWIDGELEDSERSALMAHLSECGSCARKLAEYRHLDALLSQLDAQTQVPAGLFGRIMDAVSREAEPKKSGMIRWSRWAASAAAVLLLGVAVGVLWRAGIWPAPARDAAPMAPMEAPMQSTAEEEAMMEAEGLDSGVEKAAGAQAEAPSGEAALDLYGGPVMEATWTVADRYDGQRGQSASEAIASFSAEHGLTVVETGADWITIHWEDESGKAALLSFLEGNGDLAMEEDIQETQVLVIHIR
jgi:hypothetical protein